MLEQEPKDYEENPLETVDENEVNNKEETTETSEESIKLQQELQEQKDKYVRLLAEFENYKRRTSRENMEIRQTAGKDIITALLDVLDDMDRAEEQMEKSGENNTFKEGTLLIFNKLRKTLESKGLKAIETYHTDFDVEKDEAISEVPVEDKLKGKVVAEVQKGYLLNDKLIRFAKVVVGK